MQQKTKYIQLQNGTDVHDFFQRNGTSGLGAERIRHFTNRAIHLGLTGDIVIVTSELPKDFITYIKKVTQESPTIVFAHFPPRPAPIFVKHLLEPLTIYKGKGYLFNPFIQSPTVAEFSERHDIPLAFTKPEFVKQGVVERANDKAFFREIAPQLHTPIIENQVIIPTTEIQKIIDAIEKIVTIYDGAFVQANFSGGGDGNIDIQKNDSGHYTSKLGTGLHVIKEKLPDWLKKRAQEGCEKVIVEPYIAIYETYTVGGFIPPGGEPRITGIFKQVVNKFGDYQGFIFPATGKYIAQCKKQMTTYIKKWLKYLQAEGYTGPSDIDFAIGHNKKLGKILVASESNTRWDGTRFALQHGARIAGWDLRDLSGISETDIGIRTGDHLPTSLKTTDEILKKLQEMKVPLLGLTNETEGIVIMLPPHYINQQNEVALAAIGKTVEHAEELFAEAQKAIK